MSVSERLRREVVQRAEDRCEYCRLSQTGQEAKFHVDHVQPVAEGGETLIESLALACVSCSLQKGARRRANDPVTGSKAPLFHPQRQRWDSHFAWRGVRVFGITPTGRATVELLKMNRMLALAIRAEERAHGRHPPEG